MEYQSGIEEGFKKFLRKWEKMLSGVNYQVELGFNVVEYEGPEKKESLLHALTDKSDISKVEFRKVNASEFEGNIKLLLLKGAFDDLPSHYTEGLQSDIKRKMIPRFNEYIRSQVILNRSNIYSVVNIEDYPCFDIFWSFCYLVNDHSINRSVLIWGGASD